MPSRAASLGPADPLVLKVRRVSTGCRDGLVNPDLVDLLDLPVKQDPKEKE